MTHDAPRGETISLNGWWHVWFEVCADWRYERATPPGAPLSAAPPQLPSVGWDGMDDGKESLPVPGTWAASRPGYRGVAWHWRPIAIPEVWQGWTVRVRFDAVWEWAEVYLDRQLVGYGDGRAAPLEVDVSGRVRAGECHVLALRVTCAGAERCGICGDVWLVGTR